MKERFWQLYILRCGDGTLYTGIAVDARKRLEMHRSGKGAKYTRGRGPLKMVYVEQCDSHPAALPPPITAITIARLPWGMACVPSGRRC